LVTEPMPSSTKLGGRGLPVETMRILLYPTFDFLPLSTSFLSFPLFSLNFSEDPPLLDFGL
jgi:hypothetical protein